MTTPLYNWNELPKDTPRPGIDRVAFRGDNAMAVLNWIKPGMKPGPHSHPFEQDVLDCGPGSMVRVPPNVVHYAEAVDGEVCLNLDVFAPVRADYLHLVEYQKA